VSVSTTKLETKNLENNNNAGKLKKNFELVALLCLCKQHLQSQNHRKAN
jgi:hypothetical protein